MPDSGTPPLYAAPELAHQAEALARRWSLPRAAQAPEAGLYLHLSASRLELRRAGERGPGAVYAEFAAGKAAWRLRQLSPRKEAIARAVGLHRQPGLDIVDATAGLGRDALVLAALGARLRMLERSPIIAALLEDALGRAAGLAELAEIAARMSLQAVDAVAWLTALPAAERPQVVYLDPMYPGEKGSAAAKKDMQLFRELLGPETDPAPLLAAALGCARRRVVVKRPRKAPPVSGPAPSHAIEGRSTRFDVYMLGAGP
ncbi:class I SAM-dependent methyltransferase [Alkalilimnicola sp. S0819]|uniref:class I SAM-dependent methyltransferase n=1 Tax=Alkalilimnicola sp. S0819 TaxID=2613922 RepID=UPI001261D67F|nr:class I SAM-dependent methyltransferase [Alkalilimnicola sp. S0819]KAB7622971.1 rRNA methyltransferase [Alkalilimnicola sp. S0819]MPQ17079.1 rRNA methyltransferase [Alkalilimnicola sp. S0819]